MKKWLTKRNTCLNSIIVRLKRESADITEKDRVVGLNSIIVRLKQFRDLNVCEKLDCLNSIIVRLKPADY